MSCKRPSEQSPFVTQSYTCNCDTQTRVLEKHTNKSLRNYFGILKSDITIRHSAASGVWMAGSQPAGRMDDIHYQGRHSDYYKVLQGNGTSNLHKQGVRSTSWSWVPIPQVLLKDVAESRNVTFFQKILWQDFRSDQWRSQDFPKGGVTTKHDHSRLRKSWQAKKTVTYYFVSYNIAIWVRGPSLYNYIRVCFFFAALDTI